MILNTSLNAELEKYSGSPDGIELLLGDNRGIYIPRDFIESYSPEYFGDLSEYEQVLSDPSNESYWDAWQELLGKAEVEDENGKIWTLYQDGDLFLICSDYMDDEEYQNFFGEPRD